MRNLLAVCAALAVTLGIVSGNLWYQLRSARHQIVDLQAELADAKAPVVPAAPPQLPPAVEVPSASSAAVQQPELVLPPPPAPALASAPRDVVMVSTSPRSRCRSSTTSRGVSCGARPRIRSGSPAMPDHWMHGALRG